MLYSDNFPVLWFSGLSPPFFIIYFQFTWSFLYSLTNKIAWTNILDSWILFQISSVLSPLRLFRRHKIYIVLYGCRLDHLSVSPFLSPLRPGQGWKLRQGSPGLSSYSKRIFNDSLLLSSYWWRKLELPKFPNFLQRFNLCVKCTTSFQLNYQLEKFYIIQC